MGTTAISPNGAAQLHGKGLESVRAHIARSFQSQVHEAGPTMVAPREAMLADAVELIAEAEGLGMGSGFEVIEEKPDTDTRTLTEKSATLLKACTENVQTLKNKKRVSTLYAGEIHGTEPASQQQIRLLELASLRALGFEAVLDANANRQRAEKKIKR